MRNKSRIIRLVISYAVLAVATLVYLIPFYIVLVTSFKADNSVATASPFIWFPTGDQVGFQGYVDLFTLYTEFESGTSLILIGLKNTLIIMIPVILIGMFSSTIAAYAYAKLKFKGKKIMFAILMFSMTLPGIILVIPSYFIYNSIGITSVWSMFPLIIPPIFGSATAVFFLKGFYESIPNDLLDSAKMDGLGYFKTYYKVILPLAKPAVIAQGLLGIVAVYNDYLGPLIYLREEKDYTLQIALQFFSAGSGNALPTAMAGAVISILPILLLYFCLQKYFITGLTTSGIKR